MAANQCRFRWGLVIAIVLSLIQFHAVQAQVLAAVDISPLPGSVENPPGTTITIRFSVAIDARSLGSQGFAVSGSLSGEHSGLTSLADDNQTVIFKPDRMFSLGETVQVQTGAGILSRSGMAVPKTGFDFQISPTSPLSMETRLRVQIATGSIIAESPSSPTTFQAQATADSYLTAPADLPKIDVLTPDHGTANGYLFFSNFLPTAFGGASNPGAYLLIVDNQGQPVFYQPVPATSLATDFKELPDGRLAYWQDGIYHLLDKTYREVGTVSPGNGYVGVDPHELLELPNGHWLFLVDDFRTMDLSAYGGKANALVVGIIIQELDSQSNVVFQWRSFDHIAVTDTNQDLTAATVDYIHTNAITLDQDGNLIISSRHLDEITKIDHQTGAILWRLGGKANQFAITAAVGITDDPHFYYQHDVRILANGHISLFDNHYLHGQGFSRALEFSVDEIGKQATLVWEYRNTPDVASPFMGDVQRLGNGDNLIGWGGVSSPAITEIHPDGSMALELALPAPYTSYRAYRFLWQGDPSWPPVLAVEQAYGVLHLAFSWNGATQVDHYEIYGGNRSNHSPDVLVGQQAKMEFETTADLVGIQSEYCFYQILPIDAQGQPGQASNVVRNPACHQLFFPQIVH